MKNTETNYKYFNSLVSLVLDGEASKSEREMFTHYVSTSPECKKTYEAEKSFRQLIRKGLGKAHTPQNFAHQIRMNIN